MKISILQQDLLPFLQSVSRSVGIRPTLPVLSNILLQTEDGKLKLSATNLEIGVIKRVSCEIEEEGDITVPAKTLVEIISSLPGEKVELSTSNDQLKISTSHFNASVNGISASEFPAIPLASESSVLVSAKILEQALPEITFAAASDEGRPILTGILTEIKKNSLELVATDGFRLSHKTSKIDTIDGAGFKSLIPRKTFEEVARIISEELSKSDEENIELSTSENQNQIIFKIGQTQVSSRLIEGTFPAWEKIIPQAFENRAIVEKAELLKAVKLASVFAKGEANVVRVETLENGLRLVSEAKELGSQQTDIEAQVEGSKINIAFNGKYLIDALSAAPTQQVVIEFSGNLSPAIIKPVGEKGLEYVVMPIRLS